MATALQKEHHGPNAAWAVDSTEGCKGPGQAPLWCDGSHGVGAARGERERGEKRRRQALLGGGGLRHTRLLAPNSSIAESMAPVVAVRIAVEDRKDMASKRRKAKAKPKK
jgi:hypothetical protein